MAATRDVTPRVGLCERCRHSEWLRTARSSFLRCALSDTDPRFARYPRLPVLACTGFVDRDTGRDADAAPECSPVE